MSDEQSLLFRGLRPERWWGDEMSDSHKCDVPFSWDYGARRLGVGRLIIQAAVVASFGPVFVNG